MSGHVASVRLYLTIFFALMILTGITVGVAFINLGAFNFPVAISIAVLKATLVVLYFMHARYGSRLVWVLLGCGVLWLAILIALTMADYASRGWLTTARW